MATWRDVEIAEPGFAARVRKIFDAHKHKTIATLRADGSPRISGIEAQFADCELTFGSMPGARKGADLRRDPRFALHSASETRWRAMRRPGPVTRRSPAGHSTPMTWTVTCPATCSVPRSTRSCSRA